MTDLVPASNSGASTAHAEAILAGRNRFLPGDLAVLHGRGTKPALPRSGDVLAHGGGTLDFLDRPAHRHRSILVHVRRQAVGCLRMARGMPDGGPRRDWWSGHAPARDRHGPGRPLHLGGPSPAQERPALAAGCVPHHADAGRQREPPARSPSYQHDTLPGTDLRLALRFRGGTDRRGPAIPADPDLLGLVQHARRRWGGWPPWSWRWQAGVSTGWPGWSRPSSVPARRSSWSCSSPRAG